MTEATWRKKIVAACKDAGTYKPIFDSVIDTLAAILERRDKADELYIKSGSNPVTTHTNKAKEKNIVKNPILQVWDDLNKSALVYWRDLGLTPAGLKKINEQEMTPKKRNRLAEALANLDEELSRNSD